MTDLTAQAENAPLRAAEAQIIALQEEAFRLREALVWYEQHARGCRLIHSEGDASRFELQHDGGSIARAALTQEGKA